ncbi:MAG: toxin-antitoxin system HicB family antitoxin [Polaromonas sp.]
MSTFALRLPDSLYAHAKKLAERDQASLNQFITVAVAEKVSALDAATFFAERAARGSVSSLQKILERVPAAASLKGDEL